MKSMPEIVGDNWYGSAVLEEIRRLRKTIHPIASKYHAPLEGIQSNNTLYPFVLVLGNHSSGKSSFINYLLGRKVQATGVAPTDDNFTIIGHGMEDIDRNGPALVGDPDLGFQGLESFGSVLVNHTQLKIRSDIAVKDFMIVDSPGMIDSPMHNNNASSSNNNHFDTTMDRGYNFEQVIRWYAERADVILLTFDPEKPGSTGETLSILTTSLVGLDHKLFIILNKADQFHKIHDFARAYGSLCWNLSKVIPRKDLPRIYTMCLPPYAIENNANNNNNNNNNSSNNHNTDSNENERRLSMTPSSSQSQLQVGRPTFFEQGIADLEEARHEVIKETFNAPKRRVDNEISRLTETLNSLQFHCKIVDHIAHLYQSRLWTCRLRTAVGIVSSVALTYGVGKLCDLIEIQAHSRITSSVATIPQAVEPSVGSAPSIGSSEVSSEITTDIIQSEVNPLWLSLVTSLKSWFRENPKQALMVFTGVTSGITTVLVNTFHYFQLSRYAKTLSSEDSINRVIKEILKKDNMNNDEHMQAMSEHILSYLPNTLSSGGGTEVIEHLSRVNKNDMIALERIQSYDIANLRRRASPSFPHLSPPPKVNLTTPMKDSASKGLPMSPVPLSSTAKKENGRVTEVNNEEDNEIVSNASFGECDSTALITESNRSETPIVTKDRVPVEGEKISADESQSSPHTTTSTPNSSS